MDKKRGHREGSEPNEDGYVYSEPDLTSLHNQRAESGLLPEGSQPGSFGNLQSNQDLLPVVEASIRIQTGLFNLEKDLLVSKQGNQIKKQSTKRKKDEGTSVTPYLLSKYTDCSDLVKGGESNAIRIHC